MVRSHHPWYLLLLLLLRDVGEGWGVRFCDVGMRWLRVQGSRMTLNSNNNNNNNKYQR